MKKILLHYRHFPVAMGRYIHWGLENLGYKVYSVGYYSEGKIPWGDQYYYPDHKMPPTIALPDVEEYPLEEVMKLLPEKVDAVIQAGDVHWLSGKSPVPNIIIGTDPHCVDYTPRLKNADFFFSMQNYYLKDYSKGYWLPYGYDENIHKFTDEELLYDVCFCGLQYDHRVKTLEEMESKGIVVKNAFGLIYEDYVTFYNQGKIAFNWSSQKDLPARFWEGLAMKRMMLTNYVPDLDELEFVDGEDYVSFQSKEDAIEKAQYYLSHDREREHIAYSGYQKVKQHTYANHLRVALEYVW